MNKGTKLRTILAVATSLNTALMATDVTEFHNPTANMIYKIVSVVLNFIIVACVTYYNNDYTEASAKATSRMRYEKAELIRLNNLEDGVFEEDPDGWDPDEEDEEEEDPEEVIDDDDSC